MPPDRRAELRQVGFATLDHAAAVRTATELLALGPGFGDPLLAERGLAEVGGSSGWVLSTQVPSLDGVKERAAEYGVRVAVETQAMGHDIIQLHPLDAGVLLELDVFLPRDAWFWDDLPEARAALAFGRRTVRFVPARAAGPGSWPLTCTPPTASTGPANRASCATP